ncbi:hypothetical protein BJ165DRAFT_1516346 [Panaeolus papilionaceus]|nr:hypothetical protein BJ165DRAFT_1516346 [Panaeolus papilionaceus]
MCHFRRICKTYICGHSFQMPDEEVNIVNVFHSLRLVADNLQVDCGKPYCRFSSTHPASCVQPACIQARHLQYRLFPEHYPMKIAHNCPSCPGGYP